MTISSIESKTDPGEFSTQSDKELALATKDFINPLNIQDGHCAACAFSTHLYFTKKIRKIAPNPGSSTFKKFGDWFYEKISSKIGEAQITPSEEEDFTNLKKRTVEYLKQKTSPGDSVLITISEGSHWFNAYNHEGNIRFIDSQQGRGFNLYRPGKTNPAQYDTIDIIFLDKSLVAEGLSLLRD